MLHNFRFWNWMSRDSLCTVTGHIHWVTDIDIHYERLVNIKVFSSLSLTIFLTEFFYRPPPPSQIIFSTNIFYYYSQFFENLCGNITPGKVEIENCSLEKMSKILLKTENSVTIFISKYDKK